MVVTRVDPVGVLLLLHVLDIGWMYKSFKRESWFEKVATRTLTSEGRLLAYNMQIFQFEALNVI